MTAYWSGAASEAASGRIEQLSRDVDVGAEVCAAAETVLLTFAAALRAAQADERGTLLAPLVARIPTDPLAAAPPGVAEAEARAAHADEDAAAAIDALVGRLTGVPPVVSPAPPPTPVRPPTPPVEQPPTEPEAPADDDGWSLYDWGHTAFDLVGLVPVVGEVADGANAVWCAAEGDMTMAGLSAAAMIPGAGWAATGGKYAVKGVRASKNLKGGTWVDGVNVLPSSGRTFVGTGRGTVYDVPAGWGRREADNSAGSVYQRPGSSLDSNSVRIMQPTDLNPDGYVKVTNAHNQPVTPFGKLGSRAEVHIPQTYRGGFPAWPKE